MSLKGMMLYSCPVCGHPMAGMEWEEHSDKLAISGKEFCCPDCGAGLNEDELYGKD
jgi:DNA-directed RNA polymerase subunit RPC12/RpoP